ncbi:hypothetical protein IFM89_007459 [Coptis chinensis]|uniref:Legumain prodomain domain-containing protein n=1 Tax=Coptis chinensis TaxID=261450 RepID=A0A835I8T9_9MAGN|nr:hypothetical protein IFM89_007459 [Coptis chinensis]
MIRYTVGVVLFIVTLILTVESRSLADDVLKLPSEALSDFIHGGGDGDDGVGTRWAVLIAGSSGYWNYRHQADVCHAYQIMKKGGLKDENIIVFMYDDIAFSEENPHPGVVINNPRGEDVYAGVPKDYTGEEITVGNFLAVLLGDKTALTGGMPTNPYLYADDLNDVLKKKHASGTYKSLVFYLEACESGSIFEGLLPKGLNIYATTASNAEESSWGTYCPGEYPSPPPEYDTCLGDLYSIAWMEDSDIHNLRTETLKQQYHLVKDRTINQNSDMGSHVMQYGDIDLSAEHLFLYMGSNPANDNLTSIDENSLPLSSRTVNQRDADLLHFWHKFKKSPEGSPRKVDAQKQFVDVMTHRLHIDQSIKLVGKLLFGFAKAPAVLEVVRPAGQPLVDDWNCLKTMVRTFETHCGSLSQYGMKHMRSIANICNAGVQKEQMAEASAQACTSVPHSSWSSVRKGFSA